MYQTNFGNKKEFIAPLISFWFLSLCFFESNCRCYASHTLFLFLGLCLASCCKFTSQGSNNEKTPKPIRKFYERSSYMMGYSKFQPIHLNLTASFLNAVEHSPLPLWFPFLFFDRGKATLLHWRVCLYLSLEETGADAVIFS